MTDQPESKKGLGARLEDSIAKFKKTSLVVVLIAVVGVAGGFAKLIDAYNKGEPIVTNALHPFQKDQEALDSLALGDATASVTSRLGEPRMSVDLCSEIQCDPAKPQQPVLNVYRHEDYTVRAVFDDNKLEFYSVTVETGKFKPHIKWLYDLGALGDFTFKEASRTSTVEPSAAAIETFRFPSYAEVSPLGAPGHYQGLVLGVSPRGYANTPWNLEGARSFETAQRTSSGQAGVVAAESFRVGSSPNTQGVFHDDGYVGELLHNADNARRVISVGADQ